MRIATGAPAIAVLALATAGSAAHVLLGEGDARDDAARASEAVASFPIEPSVARAIDEALEERMGDIATVKERLQSSVEWGHNFYFTRAVYSGRGRFRGGRGSWATDYPKADRQFLFIIRRLLTLLDAYEWENPVRLDDPELRRFPFLYALEVGGMALTEPEVEGLRGYLEAGGFLVIDDFWGARQWANFEYQMSRVLPGRRIVELPLDHQIFHQFYDIDEILTVPNIGNGARGGPYEECYGCPPRILAILDDEDGVVDESDRIMVVINFNTDLGDAWEWSENPMYPFRESSYAYELAINYIIYAMTH
ncbi:MAG: DUF4159 domain-containing protein [Gemmatimonadota bacterium]|nr:DUF4159 domain-containing protein [Gemmatimonadota bacterium]